MQLNTGARFVIMYVLYQLQWHKKAMPLLHRPISVTYWTCYILSNINVTLIPSLMGTLKLHSNELYYTTIQVIGTLNVDGWAVTFGTARSVLGRLRPTQSHSRCTVTSHPSMASVPTSFYSMCTYNYPCTLEGLKKIIVSFITV